MIWYNQQQFSNKIRGDKMSSIYEINVTCPECKRTFTGQAAQDIMNPYNTEHICYHCSTKKTRAITKHQEGIHAIIDFPEKP